MQRMASDLRVAVLSSETTVATFGEVLIAHFRGPTRASCVECLDKAFAGLAAKHPRVVFLGVVEAESPPPDDEARKALAGFFQRVGEQLSCVLVTYRGEGFRASMVRTVASVILNLMIRASFPRHTVRSLDEAAALGKKYSSGLDPAALLQALDELAQMHPKPGAAISG